MAAELLKDILQRAETWPEKAQQELAEIAREMDAALCGGTYRATPDELAGVDRGLRAAREGRFASDMDVKVLFATHRPA